MNSTAPPPPHELGAWCSLTEPDGTELGGGSLHDWYQDSGEQWLTVRLDRPGRVIKRCLMENLRRILLSLDNGPPHRTELYRIFFDPRLGRVCVLRLADELPAHDRAPGVPGQATPVALTRVIPARGDAGSPTSRRRYGREPTRSEL